MTLQRFYFIWCVPNLLSKASADLKNLKCQYRYDRLRTADDLRKLEPYLLDLLDSIPRRFLPSYLIFMRIDGNPFVCSTNCHMDKSMKFPSSVTNSANFKSLLLSARTQYIDTIAPHITVAEREFKEQMRKLHVRKLLDSNPHHREKVYNLQRLDSATTAYHTWSAAWQLKGKRWSFPCAKCELCPDPITPGNAMASVVLSGWTHLKLTTVARRLHWQWP